MQGAVINTLFVFVTDDRQMPHKNLFDWYISKWSLTGDTKPIRA